MSDDDGKFKKIKTTSIDDIINNKDIVIPESDLTLQFKDHIVQFEYEEGEDKPPKKTKIKPGIFTIMQTSQGIVLDPVVPRTIELLKSVLNTKTIIEEHDSFFDNLDVYTKYNREPRRAILMFSAPGQGKCLDPNQGILMYDGTIKTAKEVIVGDRLMGPDSQPRKVLSTTDGTDIMYRVTPIKGKPYIVNKDHVLSLRHTNTKKITNIPVIDFIEQTDFFKNRNKGYRSETIEFDIYNELPIDPYILGLWLGDGHTKNTALTSMDKPIIDTWNNYATKFGLQIRKLEIQDNKADTYFITSGIKYGKSDRNPFLNLMRDLDVIDNKHIPHIYKTATIKERQELLAGLIDSDGYQFDNCYEIVQKKENLADDIIFLAKSLGLAAYKSTKTVNDTKYYRIHLSGHTDQVPSKLDRKQTKPRKQIKNVLNTGITVEKIGIGNYNGFSLDGDHLFLLDDFTVTHNSTTINHLANKYTQGDDHGTVVIYWDTSSVGSNAVADFFGSRSVFKNEVKKMLFVIEDIGGGTKENSYGGGKAVESSLLELLDGNSAKFMKEDGTIVPTFTMSTTNSPEMLTTNLVDRPGRFDKIIELKAPNAAERIEILKFISKDETISAEDESYITSSEVDKMNLSIAHLQELFIRQKIYGTSIKEILKEFKDHKKKCEDAFIASKGKASVGF